MTAPETDPSPVDPQSPPSDPPPGDPRSAGDPLHRVPLARRWRIWWALGACVVLAVYVVVALAYSADSRAIDANYSSPRVDDADVVVTLTPLSVDAATPRMTLQVEVEVLDSTLLNDRGVLAGDLDVEVLPAGGAALTFAAGRIPDSRTVTVPLNGDIENWPFDSYETDIVVDAQTVVAPNGQPYLPDVGVEVGGVVQGWSGSAGATGVLGPATAADGVHLHFDRALAIKLFAGVLVLVMVLMPVLLLAVAVPLYREERLFEAGFLGYAAAMLFATVPLRNFFPGNPPAGSWVDVLVVLWVLVALIVGIGVTVLAFLRHPRGR